MLKFHNGIDHNVGIQNLPEILEASASSSDGTNSSRKLPFLLVSVSALYHSTL